jgi:uroporphyrinogen-III synthase
MQDYKATILSTRTIDSFLIKKAREKNIRMDALSFIETEPVQSIEIQQEIELAATEYATVIFTSASAVDAVTSMLTGEIPEWRIYCLSHRTRELVTAYFGEDMIEGIADSASELADLVIEHDDAEDVIFFCGNRRRDELPRKLTTHGILVNEIVVYETHAIPRKVEKNYDAVLFFSPSAAESFFSMNVLTDTCIAFAIGTATKQTIQKFCKNQILSATEPGKDVLAEQAIKYFERET